MIPLISRWLPIFSGVIGFALTLVYDLLQERENSRGRSVIAIAGAIFVSIATLAIFFLTPLPVQIWWVSVSGFIMVLLSAYMFLYSTVLEIPHADINRGNEISLIETGSYAIVRHPGFFWYFILIMSTILLYREPTVAIVAAILLLMELIVVWIEDWLLFPRFIPGYREYRQRVPMLFPFRFQFQFQFQNKDEF
jgi:protein-S-isoprenylcysteine O-methyltransferase Ste14